MSSRVVVVLTGAVVAGLAVVFAVVLLRRSSEPSVRLAGPPVSVVRTVSPQDPQFGDTVTATVDVAVDGRRVDPDSVRVQSDFAPYEVVSSGRRVRRTGDVSTIRFVYRLQCLELACTPRGDRTTVRFAALRMVYDTQGRSGALRSGWPALRVHSRVTAADLRRPFFRAGPPQVSATDYRLPPRPTGWALLALALLLAAGGVGVVAWSELHGRRRPRSSSTQTLETILRELAAASSNGDSGRRRRTLERLAQELAPLDEPLSEESRVLAWAPQDPGPEAIADLTTRVRTALRP